MRALSKISIAVACMLGASAVMADSVVRDGKVVSPTAQAKAPIKIAQAGSSSGGASAGAAVGATSAGISSTVIILGVAAAVAAAAIKQDEASTTHQ